MVNCAQASTRYRLALTRNPIAGLRTFMKVRILVRLKPGVLDPQGRAVHHSLDSLGFEGVEDVRIGRMIELDVADGTTDTALNQMCEKLLANMVIEDFVIEKVDADGAPR